MEFVYQGKGYTSMADFCRKHDISYGKLCRIRRKYRKAKIDINLAVAAAKGEISLTGNATTYAYTSDKEKSRMRYLNLKTRQAESVKNQVLELFNG